MDSLSVFVLVLFVWVVSGLLNAYLIGRIDGRETLNYTKDEPGLHLFLAVCFGPVVTLILVLGGLGEYIAKTKNPWKRLYKFGLHNSIKYRA